MAGQDTTPNTPNSQGSGDGGEKLIFGKYKTIEEAERGYKEAERKLHESNERWSKIDERFDAMETRFDEYGRGQRFAPAADPEPVQRSRSTETLTRFYQDPEAVLAERDERVVQRLRNEQAQADRNNRLVNDWLGSNRDVAEYPELLTYWVGQQDQRLNPVKKLDAAAAKVRERVAQIKGEQEHNSAPDPEHIIEAPGGQGDMRQTSRKSVQALSQESQLASYVSERNSRARKPLGGRSRE